MVAVRVNRQGPTFAGCHLSIVPLEISLVRSSLQHVPTRHEVNIQRRRPEKISGLDVAKPFYRFSRTADNASPRSQRNGKRSLPTMPENYFQDDEKHGPHLNAMLKYYSDKNSSGGRSSTPTANATDRPNITGVQLNGKRIVVEMKQLHDFVQNLHRSCGNLCVSRPSQFGVDSASHLNGDAIDATNLFLFALGSARGQKLCAPAESILEVRLE